MIFRTVFFVAAVFAYQANAQLGGMVRPFATGFANGLNEVAKPMIQFGQSVMGPVSDYISRMPQMMPYPGQYMPKPQSAYDRFDSFGSAMPGASYFQGMNPGFAGFNPQAQFYHIQSQFSKPGRPYPVPPTVVETPEKYRPSNLLIETSVPKPQVPSTPATPATLEVPKPEGPDTLDAKFDIPTMQRPLPVEDDQQ